MKNKKLLISLSSLLLLSSCNKNSDNTPKSDNNPKDNTTNEQEKIITENQEAVKKELLGCYNFFKDSRSNKTTSYGLIKDRYSNSTMASIASTGFAIASYPIFVELGYMSKEDALDITNKTFDTILSLQNNQAESYNGCLYHFINMDTGLHISNSEISTIDTAILLGGVILAYNYYGNQSLKTKGREIWSNINYVAYSGTFNNIQNLISMGATYNNSKYNLLSPWDMTAEQLMMYVFGAGNPKVEHQLERKHYDAFKKPKAKYNNHEVYYTWNGSIFTYQFSHAFIDFNKYLDPNRIDWFKNSVEASLASYEYSIDHQNEIDTYSKYAWGLTACDTPIGYSGELGAYPRGGGKSKDYYKIEGTIAPCGALGSIIFTPEQSIESLKHFQSLPRLTNPNLNYGLKDAYLINYLNEGSDWYSPDYIGIDKGITAMMLYDYLKPNFTQNLVTNDEYVKAGLNKLGFMEK